MEFYLKATGDTTDRSAEIMAMLEKFKVCILTPGTYYVSGIKMPEGTSLMGMGEGSRLVLNEDILSGSAVTLAAYCTVRDLSFIGCEEEMPRPTEVGDRHAICFVGDATTITLIIDIFFLAKIALAILVVTCNSQIFQRANYQTPYEVFAVVAIFF